MLLLFYAFWILDLLTKYLIIYRKVAQNERNFIYLRAKYYRLNAKFSALNSKKIFHNSIEILSDGAYYSQFCELLRIYKLYYFRANFVVLGPK